MARYIPWRARVREGVGRIDVCQGSGLAHPDHRLTAPCHVKSRKAGVRQAGILLQSTHLLEPLFVGDHQQASLSTNYPSTNPTFIHPTFIHPLSLSQLLFISGVGCHAKQVCNIPSLQSVPFYGVRVLSCLFGGGEGWGRSKSFSRWKSLDVCFARKSTSACSQVPEPVHENTLDYSENLFSLTGWSLIHLMLENRDFIPHLYFFFFKGRVVM